MNTTTSARLVTAIGEVWSSIRRRHPDVPDVVVTLGAGAQKGGLVLGHFAAAAWQSGDDQIPELFIGGEGLKSGADDLLVTLLHEAAHGVASTRGIKDTSRQGRYHNAKYRHLATELGLTVTQDSKLGWSSSELAPGTAETYAIEVKQLTSVLVAYRRTFAQASDGGRKNNNNGVAQCGCLRKIRVSRRTYDEGPIICGVCNEPFKAEETNNSDDEAGE